MEKLNDDAQWIVLMGFLVSFSFFFLAIVMNQSTLVGQTTAEGVVEFPKSDIRDIRTAVIRIADSEAVGDIPTDLTVLSLARRNAVFSSSITCWDPPGDPWVPSCKQKKIWIHYNNGVTAYNETSIL